jgi:L-fucose isomerase-like protein
MARRVRLGVVGVASPLEVGAGDAPALAGELGRALDAHGGIEVVIAPPSVNADVAAAAGRLFYDHRVDAVCVIAASWFEDYLILDALEECRVPVILWARPGMETGALCGMQQAAFMLRQLGLPFCFIFEPAGSPSGIERVAQYASAAALRAGLRRARIGHLGYRVEGMTETTAHELALKKIFGPRVVGIDSAQFLAAAAAVDPACAAEGWRGLAGRVGSVTATVDAGVEALQVYSALRQTVADLGLDAVAVGCYPHLMGKVCLSGSLLGEAGIPMACEGDINGALAMLMLTRLSGAPVHNTDLLDPIPAENAIVFSHCGSGAFELAAGPAQITLGPVRLMNRGVCSLFPSRPGIVTMVNIVATLSGYRLAVLYGEATETDMIFPGNPLRVRFASPYAAILEWIAGQGIGHHWMAAYGDLRRPLEDLAGMTGCEFLSLA